MNKNNTLKFLTDRPLTADKEQDIRFGHLGIAKTIQEIVASCPLPFTIGLFGKWGSGKTTILNVLTKRLRNDKAAVVNFDVWKHEGDALRRTFLIELVEQLKNQGLSKNFKLSTRVDKTITTQREIQRISWKTCLVVAGVIVAAFAVAFPLDKYGLVNLSTYLSVLLGGSSVSAVLLWLFQHMIITDTITEKAERLQDPHEFEAEFKRVLRDVRSEKLLIIIDNLDRCTHSRAVELLSTIKTFLAKDTEGDNNKCIFLIACDDEAIKKHLESVYANAQSKENNGKSFRGDEFLRKFFNVFVRIPDFINSELQTYTEDLLKETGIPQFDSPDVAYVITNAFRENPRQIKQFINVLIAHFILAQERESGPKPLIVPEGLITNNVPFLSKFLIIRQRFPLEYQRIRDNYLSIEEVAEKAAKNKSKEYKDFVRATKSIASDDIRPFIYLKQSEEELTIPGIKELEIGLLDNKGDLVKERLKAIKVNSEQVNSLKRFVPNLIDRNKSRKIPLLNIISCSLEVLRHHNLELGEDFYNKVADLLNDDRVLKPELPRFDPLLIFNEILTRCRNEQDRTGIIGQYIGLLHKPEGEEEKPKISVDLAHSVLKQLRDHKEWLKDSEKRNIKQIIATSYYSSIEVLSLFADKIEDQKEFVSEETISQFVSTFSNDDVEDKQSINNKMGLLLKFKEALTPKTAQNIVTSLQNLLKNENQKGYREQKENLLDRIGNVFDVLYEQIETISDKAVLNSFAEIVIQGVNALGNWNQKKTFVFICLKLLDMLEDPLKSNINTVIQNFLTNADLDSIKFVFDKFDKKTKVAVIKMYPAVFQQKVIQQQPVFDLLYPLAPTDIRTNWIVVLISSQTQRALTKLEELGYKVDDKKAIVKALLDTAKSVGVGQKKSLYEAINKLKCANDTDMRNVLAAQIKSLLKNTDTNQQQVGYSALQGAISYISATVKREIARETVEWLRLLEPANAGQSYSAKSVILNWDSLALESLQPVRNEYLDFVFDKLIKRGANVSNIRLGFEVLSEIKPKYEDYSAQFDDIFAKAESESNNEVKIELKSGLLKIKPPKTNSKNKVFWEKVEKVQTPTE